MKEREKIFFPKQCFTVLFFIIAIDLSKEFKLKSQVQGPCRTGPLSQVQITGGAEEEKASDAHLPGDNPSEGLKVFDCCYFLFEILPVGTLNPLL